MGSEIISLLEPVVVIATLFGVACGVKLLVWGRGPIKGNRRSADPGLERRVQELEERLAQQAEATVQQGDLLVDMEERLDFAERMLTQQRAEPNQALPRRRETTPV